MPMIITRGAVSARGFGFGAQASAYTYQVAAIYPNAVKSFVVPAGVTSLTVEVIGPGGIQTSNRGGGGGGAYAKSVVTVSPGDTYYMFTGAMNSSDAWGNTSNAEPSSTTTGALAKRATGITGGSATSSIGTTKFAGGNGVTGGAGAGAGGPAGAGKNGVTGGGGGAGGASSTNGVAGNTSNGGTGGSGPAGTGAGVGATYSPQAAATSGTWGLGGGGGGARMDYGSYPLTYPTGAAGNVYSYFGGNYGPGGGGGAGQADTFPCPPNYFGAGGGPNGFGAGGGTYANWTSSGLVVVSFTSTATVTGWASVQNAWFDATAGREARSPILNSAVAGSDSSGNIYTVGQIRVNRNVNENRSFYVQKVSSKGVFQWQRTLTPASALTYQYGSGSVTGLTDTSGNTYILGTNSGASAYLAKYNSSGTIQWQKNITYGYTNLSPKDMCFDASGNIWIVGTCRSSACFTPYACWVWKFDTSGNSLASYEKNLGSAGATDAITASIKVGASGNVYVGYSWLDASACYVYNVYLLKLNSTLSSVSWSKSGNTGANYYQDAASFGVQLDSSENVYWYFVAPGKYALSVAKFNSSGTLQWSYNQTYGQDRAQLYNPLNGSQNFGLALDSSANSYIGYFPVDPTSAGQFMNITKLNSSGAQQWATRFYPIWGSRFYNTGPIAGPMYVSGTNLVFATGTTYNDLVALPTSGVTAGNYAPYVFAADTNTTNTTSYVSAASQTGFSTATPTVASGTSTDAAGFFTSSFQIYITS